MTWSTQVIYKYHTRTDVRHFDLQEGLVLSLEVAEAVYERVDLELFLPLALVQNEVAGEEHEVGELVALTLVALQRHLEHQSAQAAPRVQYAHAVAVHHRLWVALLDFVDQRLVAHVALRLTQH